MDSTKEKIIDRFYDILKDSKDPVVAVEKINDEFEKDTLQNMQENKAIKINALIYLLVIEHFKARYR